MVCTVHGNEGIAPLLPTGPHTWEARVTIHRAGAYDSGIVWREDGMPIEFKMTTTEVFHGFGVLFISFHDEDPGLPAELRRALLELAA